MKGADISSQRHRELGSSSVACISSQRCSKTSASSESDWHGNKWELYYICTMVHFILIRKWLNINDCSLTHYIWEMFLVDLMKENELPKICPIDLSHGTSICPNNYGPRPCPHHRTNQESRWLHEGIYFFWKQGIKPRQNDSGGLRSSRHLLASLAIK